MSYMRKNVWSGVLVLGLWPLGCTGTETGNPPRPTLSFQIESSAPMSVSPGTSGPGISITETRINVSEVSLIRCEDDGRELVIRETVVDLAAGDGSFELPDGDFCGLSLNLTAGDLDWGAIRPNFSSDLSCALAGTTSADVPLFIQEAAPLGVMFVAEGGLAPAPGTHLALALDLAELLDSDLIESLNPNGSGEVSIDVQFNPNELENVRLRFAPSWRLYQVDEDAWERTEIARGSQTAAF